MLGKIIGVGMVGLTQFFLWIAISVGLSFGLGAGIMKMSGPATPTEIVAKQKAISGTLPPIADAALNTEKQENKMSEIMEDIAGIRIGYTLSCFIFYFLFGYMLYSAIFAAVGSAVDNETETQQFMLPITLPLVFTFALSQSFIINNPDSNIAFWLSMIPFTSPIAMMIRIPFGVPNWQLALSMLFMIAGFLFTTWVAARIYKVGILMYGKKASYKELAKWFMYKE
jgi:ABC-2 type transport system permease protein